MDAELVAVVLQAAGARAIVDTQIVQSLWSGYGQILRCRIEGGSQSSVIVKHVRWPDQRVHRYGWNLSLIHI